LKGPTGTKALDGAGKRLICAHISSTWHQDYAPGISHDLDISLLPGMTCDAPDTDNELL
jgi:hypothetical protein